MLESQKNGKRIGAINTHFWWKHPGDPEHDALRVSNAKKVHETASYITEKYGIPVFAFGDLNSMSHMPCIVYLKENGWKLVRDEAPVTSEVSTHHGDPLRGEDGRFHGKTTDRSWEMSIDHILFLGRAEPKKFYLVEDQTALDATDHSPIWCDFEL